MELKLLVNQIPFIIEEKDDNEKILNASFFSNINASE
jgi:hypothetical protein